MGDERHRDRDYETPWGDPTKLAKNLSRAIIGALNDMGETVNRTKRSDVEPFSSSPAGPHAEVLEDDEKVCVIIDLPGVKQEDLDISLESDRLVVSGERKSPEEGGPEVRRQPYGPIRKRVKLPCEVEENKVEAQLADGVLTDKLPKKKAKKIKVSVKKAGGGD
jgi:HSP20 family protein